MHCVNPIQRTYPTSTKKKGKDPYLGSLNQGFLFFGQDGGSVGAEEKGISGGSGGVVSDIKGIRYGAKNLSEKKKMRRKNILLVLRVEPMRWFINWHRFNVFSPCFLKCGKTEK